MCARDTPIHVRSPALGLAFALGGALTFAGALWLGAHLRERAQPGVVGLEKAWEGVQRAPQDPAAWAALGDAQAAMDEPASAEHSYETAIRIGGPDHRDGPVHARLGFLLYARGEDERALALLEEADRLGADLPMLDETIMELQRRKRDAAREQRAASTAALPTAQPGEAAPQPDPIDGGIATGELDASVDPGPPPVCTVPFVPSDRIGVHRVPVVASGVELLLVFDTGASLTTLTEEAIAKLGVAEDPTQRVRAVTASGRVEFPTAVVGDVTIANRTVRDLRVAICRGCGGTEADGLLGLDVMGALGLELDLKQKRIVFAGCRP